MWMGSWLSSSNGFGMVVFGTVVGDVEESTKLRRIDVRR